MYATDRRQTDVIYRTKASLNVPARGGHNNCACCFLTTTNWLAVAMQTSVKRESNTSNYLPMFLYRMQNRRSHSRRIMLKFQGGFYLLYTTYYRESGFLFSWFVQRNYTTVHAVSGLVA